MPSVCVHRVLIIDDDPGDTTLIAQAIQAGPFACAIEHASDGDEALAWLIRTEALAPSRMPHLILLDYKLPRQDGLDVLAEISARPSLRPIPVVMMSTSPHEPDISAGYRLGARGYIAKPMEIEDLFAVIHGILRYWFLLVRRPPGPIDAAA